MNITANIRTYLTILRGQSRSHHDSIAQNPSDTIIPRIAIIAICLIFAPSLFAQAVAYGNFVSTTSGVKGSFAQVLAIPGSSIAVCVDSACATRATTYTSITAGTPCSTLAQVLAASGTGPCTSLVDGQGNYFFWISPGTYYVRITTPAKAGGATFTFPITAGGSGGGGGVSSVSQTVPSWLVISGSPVTGIGTLAITPASGQTSHQVIGTCGTATSFAPCPLAVGDIPGPLNQNTTGTAANLSGTPSLPNGTTGTTQAPGDNTTKLATDSFVLANAGACATCVTSTATLTLNALMVGVGSRASSTIAGDSNTAHALFATAGVPAFRAIVAGDIPTLNQNTTGTASNLSGTPALPNGVTATTQTVGDNTTKLATDAFVIANSGGPPTGAAGGVLTGTYPNPGITILNQNTTGTAANLSGTPVLPNGTTATTQFLGDNSNRIATDAFVFANAVGGPPSGPAGGSLTGAYPNPGIANSITLPGSPVTTTQLPADNSTKIATTAFVNTAVTAGASPIGAAGGVLTGTYPNPGITILNQNTSGTAGNLSGTPTLPNGTAATTQTLGDSTTKLATTAFVIANAVGGPPTGAAGGSLTGTYPNPGVATLNQNTSGTAANLSGTPTLPNGTAATTQTMGDSSTKIATDAFVLANGGGTGCAAMGGAGVVQKSDGSGACLGSSITDNGTNVTTTEPIKAAAISAGGTPPTCTIGTGGANCMAEGTVPSVGAASGVDVFYASSTQHGFLANFNNAGYLPLVQGPASATNGHVAVFSGTNGGLLADGGAAGIGTVLSVGQTVPSWLTVTGSPVTSSGTLAVTPTTGQAPHQVIGTCNTGTTFTPCPLVIGDLPTNVVNTLTNTNSNGASVLSGNSLNIPALPSGAANQMLKYVSPTATIFDDFADTKIVPFANCNNGTAGAAVSSTTIASAVCIGGANNIGGAMPYSVNNWAIFNYELPADWSTTQQPWINIFFSSATNTTGNVVFTTNTACTKSDGTTSSDPAFTAPDTAPTVTITAANREWSTKFQMTHVTSGNNCIPGGTMIVSVFLTGAPASPVLVDKATMTIARRLVNQAE